MITYLLTFLSRFLTTVPAQWLVILDIRPIGLILIVILYLTFNITLTVNMMTVVIESDQLIMQFTCLSCLSLRYMRSDLFYLVAYSFHFFTDDLLQL